MKRNKWKVLPAILLIFFMGGTADAQSVPPEQLGIQLERVRRQLEVQGVQQDQLRIQDLTNSLRELERAVNIQQRTGGRGLGAGQATGGPVIVRENRTFTGAAWWTNTALVERLGITDEQKARIERAFENHRQRIVSSTEQLEKDEAQLAKLLEAESIDRNAILGQIDRVVQARGEMERANAAMTLEMRESLTAAQWAQLPQPNANVRILTLPAGVPGARSGGGGRGGAPAQTSPEAPPAPPPPGQQGGRRGGRGQ
jgi:hypothetical protein